MVEMDLSNRCQLKCDFCTFRYIKDRSDIPTKYAMRAITDMANMGVKSINFTGGGEPTLHKDFADIIGHAADVGLDVGLFTNGYNLTEKTVDAIVTHCHWVRISIDASNKQSFLRTKCVDGFAKTMHSVKFLCERKRYFHTDCDIGVGFVITPKNYKEIYFFAELFRKMKEIRYVQFKPMIDNCFESSHIEKAWWKDEVEPILKKTMADFPKAVINYYKFNDLVSDIERDYDICYGHQFCPCVGATGDVWVCTHLRNIEGYSFGRLSETTFEHIWNSTKRQDVIKTIDLPHCQKYCRNNEINKVLYQMKHPSDDMHENFI